MIQDGRFSGPERRRTAFRIAHGVHIQVAQVDAGVEHPAHKPNCGVVAHRIQVVLLVAAQHALGDKLGVEYADVPPDEFALLKLCPELVALGLRELLGVIEAHLAHPLLVFHCEERAAVDHRPECRPAARLVDAHHVLLVRVEQAGIAAPERDRHSGRRELYRR